MKDFQWKKSNYKQMQGRWKIGILLEAGYRECDTLENQSELIKISDRIYFQNALLPYPKSEQLSQSELEYWRQGIRLVSAQIEKRAPYLIVALRNIQFSVCDIQEEAFTASAMQWASEMFGFPMPEVKVIFDKNINPPYGKYVYDFNTKIAFHVWKVEQNMDVNKVCAIIGDNHRFVNPLTESDNYYICANHQMSDEEISAETIDLYWEKLEYASKHALELIQQAFRTSYYDFYGVKRDKIHSADEMSNQLTFESFVLVAKEREIGACLSNSEFMFGHFIECRWDDEWNLIYSSIC